MSAGRRADPGGSGAEPTGDAGDSPGTRRLRAVRDGLALVGLAVIALVAVAGTGTDATSYWSLDLRDPYAAATGSLTGTDAFRYAPPVAFVLAPLGSLPFEAFRLLWLALGVISLVVLAGWRTGLALAALYPVALELSSGNVHLELAFVAAAGFRWPALWSVALLTKVTPGIGLLWFAVRREWRALGLALGATAAIVVLSAVATPGLWVEWLELLRSNAGLQIAPGIPYVPVPLALRLSLAVAVVVWGARRDARWVVPVAMTLALPTLWIHGLAILVAVLPLRARHPPSRPVRRAG